MARRKKILAWAVVIMSLLVIAATALAPSWRIYYPFRRGLRIVEDRSYLPGSPSPRHQLDLYLPKAGGAPFPVVVFVHGGYWRPLDRRVYQPITGLHGAVGVALAHRGIGTAVIGYRQYPEAPTLEDAMQDVAAAVRHVVDHIQSEGGDPSRIYLIGHSAGGMLTALLALQPEHLARAGVDVNKVRGFASLASPYNLEKLAAGFEGDMAEKIRRSAKDAAGLVRYSAIKSIHPNHPPLLLIVGSREVPALLETHREMTAALKSAGGDVTSVEARDADHMDLVMQLAKPNDPTLQAILQFIEKH
jgi:acetyl esterase/lipase